MRVVSSTLGTRADMPREEREALLVAHAGTIEERMRKTADTLLERILVDGAPSGIQLEDIERFISIGKMPDGRDPAFMRKVLVELLVCLRPKK